MIVLPLLLLSLLGVARSEDDLPDGSIAKTIYENSTSYLPIQDIVDLQYTKDYDLKPVNWSANPNIQIDYVPMYREQLVVSHPNQRFVQSFGFRYGGVSSWSMQVIVTHSCIYVYNLTQQTSGKGLRLKQINEWIVSEIVGKFEEIYIVNSSSLGVQRVRRDGVEFIVVA